MVKYFLLRLVTVVSALVIGTLLSLYIRKKENKTEDEILSDATDALKKENKTEDEILSDAINAFSSCATETGRKWCNKLVATNVLGMRSSKQTLDIDTVYGRIRFCDPVTVIARAPSGQVIADSTEALQNVLHLPISGHSLDHWFSGRGNGTVEGGGGPTPKIKILSCKFNQKIVVTGRLSSERWEPHLNGDFEIKMHWMSKNHLNRGLLLPIELDIHLSTKFGKLMWNCEIPRYE